MCVIFRDQRLFERSMLLTMFLMMKRDLLQHHLLALTWHSPAPLPLSYLPKSPSQPLFSFARYNMHSLGRLQTQIPVSASGDF